MIDIFYYLKNLTLVTFIKSMSYFSLSIIKNCLRYNNIYLLYLSTKYNVFIIYLTLTYIIYIYMYSQTLNVI